MMATQTLVMKFGGTSVGSADALKQAAQIIKDARSEYPRLVVITSAMSGVTDLLLKSATLAAQGQVDSLPDTESTLRQKHFSAADALIKDENRCAETKAQIDSLIHSLVDL
ncbi:MAG TPA: aspartate kinase, partial [Anaerolineales bacterium]|nr:aspartate kinase [Anaerolineales bacterium]